jgi:hypothetical protein
VLGWALPVVLGAAPRDEFLVRVIELKRELLGE